MTDALPILAATCQSCHGAMPQFGAPVPLVDYGPLVDGAEGSRLVDRVAARVEAGTMPPVGSAQPTVAQRDTLVRWATCGERGVRRPAGTTVSRPPFESPAVAPEGLTAVDLTADDESIGSNVRDDYREFFFTDVVDRDLFVRRLESVVDETRVIHHLTLERAREGGGMRYLYTWAPGTGAFQFPEGGIRLRPTDRLRLEIHYNNGQALDGVTDSSGVRIYLDEPVGTEYLMADPGPGAFGWSIRPRSEGSWESTCTVREDVTALATMPHMHEIGSTFEVLVDGVTQLSLEGWSFENQLFYDLPLQLREGQELTVRCGYRNPRSESVFAGLRTEDEMCFAFTYITPASENFCR